MNIGEGSTNTQIENWMRNNFKGNFLGCFWADTLPELIPSNSNLIVNYSDRGEDGGTHWVGMGNLNSTSGQSFYFDSFGHKPDKMDGILNKKTKFLEYIRRHSPNGRFRWNGENIQSKNADTCGHYACYAIKQQCVPHQKQYNDPWEPFYSPFTTQAENDIRIRNLVRL